MKNIYLIVGMSGSGKSTITKRLCEKYNLKQLYSHTTRTRRYENEGNYIFIEPDTYFDFDEVKQQYPNRIAETIYDGQMYFATEEDIFVCDVYVVDPSGVEFFRGQYKGDKGVKAIYIDCDVVDLTRRMQARGDNFQSIARRLYHDSMTFENAHEIFDFAVVNDASVEKAVDAIWNYIREQEGIDE